MKDQIEQKVNTKYIGNYEKPNKRNIVSVRGDIITIPGEWFKIIY